MVDMARRFYASGPAEGAGHIVCGRFGVNSDLGGRDKVPNSDYGGESG